jgi:hypothetical protein
MEDNAVNQLAAFQAGDAGFFNDIDQAIADSTHAGRGFHLMPGQRSTA